MNPFIFDPRKITTPDAASYVASLYDKEVAASLDVSRAIEDNLNAVSDALHQTHPDLAADLDLLIEHAKYAGHAEGTRQDLNTLKSQFLAALPYAIKKQRSS
jgi:hypothetical protein